MNLEGVERGAEVTVQGEQTGRSRGRLGSLSLTLRELDGSDRADRPGMFRRYWGILFDFGVPWPRMWASRRKDRPWMQGKQAAGFSAMIEACVNDEWMDGEADGDGG